MIGFRATRYLWLCATGLLFRLVGRTGGFSGGASGLKHVLHLPSRDGSVETGDDSGSMILVELLYSRLEVRAFLSLDEQLRDLGATLHLHVLWTDISHFVLLGMGATAVGLDVRRTQAVIGELALVLGLGDLGFAVPELAVLE